MKIVSSTEFSLNRSIDYGNAEQNEIVQSILEAVKREGDQAVLRYTTQLDQVTLSANQLQVAKKTISEAYNDIDPEFLTALRAAIANIQDYHERQKRQSWMVPQQNGAIVGQIVRPLKRVGVYVPGGKAAYPSSVMMNVIPALVAGVEEIVMVTPPSTAGSKQGIDPYILVAAAELGVKEIYQVGGAQAIAALAYGTETIPAVDKIVGPGNIYVALAKRGVFGTVDIDSIAGPSEIVVLADEGANAVYIAADLLSQAEHDVMAASILVTSSEKLALEVQEQIKEQLRTLPRRAIAEQSIDEHGAILLVNNLDEGIAVVNQLAPEHLQIMVDEPWGMLNQIENAGAIFLGEYSSEPIGDYFAGPNHIIPTNGTARFSSPLSVDDFIKKSSLIHYSKEAVLEGGHHVVTLAKHEGLAGHARAVQYRLDDLKPKL